MDRTLISWSVPNMITIWLMLAIGFIVFAFASQFGLKWIGGGGGGSSAPAETTGGY